MTTTQEVVYNAGAGLVVMPFLGFLGAVFLNWACQMTGVQRSSYWRAYRITTFGGMAVLVVAVPIQLFTSKFGPLAWILDSVTSMILMGVVVSHWIKDEGGRALELGDTLVVSVIYNMLWLLIVGVGAGLYVMTQSGRVAFGAILSIACAGLLYWSALFASREPSEQAAPPAIVIPVETGEHLQDFSALYAYALDELEQGRRDEKLWLKAVSYRGSPQDQREWYLAARVQQLKGIAEEQLRREAQRSRDT